MSERLRDYSWLPTHQYHVALTLAHVDGLVDRAGAILFDYLKPGPLAFTNVAAGDLAHLTVADVVPLPSAVSRLAADALTQLRAAIEHTIFAQVEHELCRELDESESRRIEMPACKSPNEFSQWLRSRHWQDLAPLRDGAELCRRLRELQPYQHRDVDRHPLRVLAEHTNLAKHRTPAVAATLLGTVVPDWADPELMIASGDDKPLQPGDILVTGPLTKRVPVSIWPKVSIQRPHTRTWHVVIRELGELEAWVRTVAVPLLIAGVRNVDPLPPQLDTATGHHDLPAALRAAGMTPAAERATRRIQATVLHESLTELLALHSASPPV